MTSRRCCARMPCTLQIPVLRAKACLQIGYMLTHLVCCVLCRLVRRNPPASPRSCSRLRRQLQLQAARAPRSAKGPLHLHLRQQPAQQMRMLLWMPRREGKAPLLGATSQQPAQTARLQMATSARLQHRGTLQQRRRRRLLPPSVVQRCPRQPARSSPPASTRGRAAPAALRRMPRTAAGGVVVRQAGTTRSSSQGGTQRRPPWQPCSRASCPRPAAAGRPAGAAALPALPATQTHPLQQQLLVGQAMQQARASALPAGYAAAVARVLPQMQWTAATSRPMAAKAFHTP